MFFCEIIKDEVSASSFFLVNLKLKYRLDSTNNNQRNLKQKLSLAQKKDSANCCKGLALIGWQYKVALSNLKNLYKPHLCYIFENWSSIK